VSAAADIVILDAPVADTALDQLAAIFVDCVEGGASVSFMSPFSHAEALIFFRKVAGSVAYRLALDGCYELTTTVSEFPPARLPSPASPACG
jgi:hypothetical protein